MVATGASYRRKEMMFLRITPWLLKRILVLDASTTRMTSFHEWMVIATYPLTRVPAIWRIEGLKVYL